MKFLFISYGDLRFEFVAYNLAQLLCNTYGHEVTICGYGSPDQPSLAQWAKGIQLVPSRHSKVRQTKIPKIVIKAVDYFRFILKCLRISIRINPNVVLCTNYDSLWIGKLVALIHEAKFIYYCTEYSERLPFLKIRSPRQLLKWFEKFILTSSDIIVAVEPWRAEQLQLQTGKQVIVVRNTPLLKPNHHFPLQSKQDKSSLINFVYAGNIVESSGIIEFIKAISFFPKDQVSFHIYGRVDGNIKENFWHMTQKVFVEGIPIAYHGIIDYKLLHCELQKYDVGVCLYKGLRMNEVYCAPSKLFEYCRAGLALIVTKLPGIYNAIGEREFVFYIEEVSPEAIALGIQRVIQVHQNLDNVKAQAYDIHIRKFNYNLELEKLLSELRIRKWL